jgi:restriction system protein
MTAPARKNDAAWGHSTAISEEDSPPVEKWSLEALRSLEWKRFELLCAEYYEAINIQSQTIQCGADGGVDVKLFKVDPHNPIAVVQCKAWSSSVGVKHIRELLGVMAYQKVRRGIFITTSTFTKDAKIFGDENPIQLLDGAELIRKIVELPKDKQERLLKKAFEGDYRTPTCASCGVKMKKRQGTQSSFWGCVNYPRCKSIINIKQGNAEVES